MCIAAQQPQLAGTGTCRGAAAGAAANAAPALAAAFSQWLAGLIGQVGPSPRQHLRRGARAATPAAAVAWPHDGASPSPQQSPPLKIRHYLEVCVEQMLALRKIWIGPGMGGGGRRSWLLDSALELSGIKSSDIVRRLGQSQAPDAECMGQAGSGRSKPGPQLCKNG